MSMKKRILLVEDEENFGSLLQNYLRLSKYEVEWAKDGALGYSAFVKGNYDLCIFDVMMPNMDGFTVCETMRNQPETADIPIILLSARTSADFIQRGKDAGANSYLGKPIGRKELVCALNEVLQDVPVSHG